MERQEEEIYTGNLDLIVTHYREPWRVGKKLFDSIALQRNIQFADVRVILVNDGEENELPKECFEGYPYEIHQISIPHGGVSRARNAGLDASNADWVMFCDFDDCFQSLFGLHLILNETADDQCDLIRCSFTEETKDNNGVIHLVAHDDDTVFVHGKVLRRKFLEDNGLRFHDKLLIHEDGYFNVLTFVLAKGREKKILTTIYLWAWNDDSVVRKSDSDDFVFDTYDHLIRQRIALTDAFISRGMKDEAVMTVVKSIVDSYYDFQQHEWRLQKNRVRRETAERWICAYLKRFAMYYIQADVKMIGEIATVARARNILKKTFIMESETLKEWTEHIMRDVHPIPEEEQGV